MDTARKVLLVILDGFGEGKPYRGNAIYLAKTPTLDALKKKYPHTVLKASGNAVGIPKGFQGGSEVGHFTIGAGRVTWQSFEAINRSIKNKEFFEKPALIEACKRANKGEESALHLIGMISDQGVHSDIRHLFALLKLAKKQKVKKTYIHAITDGRDVPEKSAEKFIRQIKEKISALGMKEGAKSSAKIATIIGRYYAMDRDTNWNRTAKAYDLYTLGKGTAEKNPRKAIRNAYSRGDATDYYIKPIILDEYGIIKNKDSVIFWNFRSDRSRQLTWAFTGEKNSATGKPIEFKSEKIVRPFFVCMGPFSEKAKVVFPTPIIKNNLAQVLSKRKLKQFRIAETEKYAHVTFFFNSQAEKPYSMEDRLLIDSPKCPSYAAKPEMSARKITKALMPKLNEQKYDFIALNFANCDLVGHSGELEATIKAVETVDECLGRIVPSALKNSYDILITGDHGNAEYMIYKGSGKPCPSHTTNPVPLIVISNQNLATSGRKIKLKKGELKDIAATILNIMKIPIPKEMTGKNLLQ